MKIGIVCFNLFMAGGARLVFHMAQVLKTRGHQVVIYTPEFDASDYGSLAEGLDIRVVRTKGPITYFRSEKPRHVVGWLMQKARHEKEFISVSRAIAEAMDPDFDVVSIHDSSYRAGYYYKQRNRRARVVWTVNGPPFRYLSRGKWWYDAFGYAYQAVKRITAKKFMEVVDEATVLANEDKAWLAGYPVKHVSVVRAGLDVKRFYAPVKEFRAKAAKKYIQLLAVGALNPFRRYDNVLEAVKLLRDWGYDAHARVIANNIWNENATRDALLKYVSDHHLEEAVTLQFTASSEDDLVKAYQDADVFVNAVYVPPPGHHGWGLVNFEAMAAGTPIVIVNVSTATEVLEDGKTAIIVPPLAPETIAIRIKELIDNPARYEAIAKAGQALVERTMSWEKYAEEMEALFRA